MDIKTIKNEKKCHDVDAIILMARNKESAMQIVKSIIALLEDVFLGDDKSKFENLKAENAPSTARIITETFDGRIMVSSRGDLTNPRFFNGYSVSPFFSGTAKDFIEFSGVTTDINHDSAQMQETKDHLYFVQAMRIFFNELGETWSLTFNDSGIACQEISDFHFFEGKQ